MPADITPLASEGVMPTVSKLTDIEFSKVKNGFDINMDQKVKRVMERERLTEEEALNKIKKVESERENHCYYFTRKRWKDMANLTVHRITER